MPLSKTIRLLADSLRLCATGLLPLALAFMPGTPVSAQETSPVTFPVREYVVEGSNPLSERTTRNVLAPYVREQATLDTLRAALKALEDEMRSRGFAFYRVTLPPQDAQGSIRLKILSFPIENIDTRGNDHFSRENVLRALPVIKAGESPNMIGLARALGFANEHPSRNLNVLMRQSDVGDALEAQVQVRDERPWRLFAGANNSGTSSTGRTRVFAGLQHSNLYQRDHTATLSYTTSAEKPSSVQQFGVYYRIPVYSHATVYSLYAVKSDVDSGTVAEFFEVSGRGQFYGVSATHTFLPAGAYTHKAGLTYEDRQFHNDVTFNGSQIAADVRSRPVTLRYDGRFENRQRKFDFGVEYIRNIPGGADNTDAAYSANRAGSDPQWEAIRTSTGASFAVARWRLDIRARGQYSREPLVSAEQIGVGGAQSVRGYEERETAGDKGWYGSVEFVTPEIFNGLRLLAFADGGKAEPVQSVAGVSDPAGISSAGIGLRWQIKRSATLSLDAANALDSAAITRSGDTFVHGALAVRF